jgi:hypothetical protein
MSYADMCDRRYQAPAFVHLSAAKVAAPAVACEWGLELGEPFAFSHVSYVDSSRGSGELRRLCADPAC